MDIIQAHLLEKALGGSVDEGNGAVSSRTNLAADPNPPTPPPPPLPVLELALLLDIPDECVTKRPYSQMGMLYQWEFNAMYLCLCAPTHYTSNQLNVNSMFMWFSGADTYSAAATTSHTTYKNLYLAQIQHR